MKNIFTNKKIIVIVIIFVLLCVAVVFELDRSLKIQYHTKDITVVAEDDSNNGAVPIIMRSVGPLEPENTYPEIQPNKNVSEESRIKANKWFKDNAVSCFYNDIVTKDFLIESLNSEAGYREETKKAISGIDLQKMSLDEIRKLYVKIKQPENNNGYNISVNKNNILAGYYYMDSSYCGWEAHPNTSQNNFIIDLNTGNEVTLGDVLNTGDNFLNYLTDKINGEYISNGADSPDNECLQYIKDDYPRSYDLQGKDKLSNLKKETSFTISTTTLSIIPTGYPHAIEGPCGGTSIDFLYSELVPYIKKSGIIERLK